MKNLKLNLYKLLIIYGLVYLKIFGYTPRISYTAFRKFYVLNNPKGFNFFNKLFTYIRPKKNYINDGIIKLNSEKLNDIINNIEKNGFYIFDEKISNEILESIKSDLSKVKVIYNGSNFYLDQIIDKVDYPRFDYDIQQLLNECPELLKLTLDKSFFTIASYYLNCNPYMDLIACWFSKPSKNGKSEAAQEYHYDLDRFKFIKFFIYLNDVTNDNGPHCYIKSSNHLKPNQIEDRRYKDAELLNTYSKKDFIEITGNKGSIIAVDTIGYHKGKELIKGERLIFQIEYANSMFGQNYPKISLNNNEIIIEKEFRKIFKKNI